MSLNVNVQPTTDSQFRGTNLLDCERYRQLDRSQAYYDCTQHDFKRYDFDGRIIMSANQGMGVTQPMLGAEKAAYFVPLRSRRPSSPYRLGRVMVNAFTNMLFGESRFPKGIIEGDSDSQDYVQTLMRVGGLAVKCILARSLGGATGTGCMSWCYYEGKPRFEAHNAKHCFVHSWEDREQFITKHVTECYQFPRYEVNPQTKRVERKMYWYRRDWTPNADILFNEVEVIGNNVEPLWTPNVEKSVTHNDGVSHFSWMQNLPSNAEDGLPDYDGLYESLDTIDLLYSVITRGATLNLDPTLVLKMNPDQVNRMGVKKGSDNALVTGEGGGASYLELGGQSITAGISLFDSMRKSALETAQCIVPDPKDVSSQGTSSMTMKLVYAPMLGKLDILRDQYGNGIKRLLEPMLTVARHQSKRTIIIYAKDGTETEAELCIDLPPRIEKEPEEDDEGLPTGEEKVDKIERDPGEGGELTLEWGPYFEPTGLDQQQAVTTLSLASGGARIMSAETATEIVMHLYGRNPQDEKMKVAKAAKEEADKQAEMMPPPGMGDPNAMPGGDSPPGAPPPGGGAFGKPKKAFGGKPKFGGGKPKFGGGRFGKPKSIAGGGEP